MPTFQQIKVDPPTQHRLMSGLKRKRGPPSDLLPPPCSADAALTSSFSFAPVRTPSALLSRDPIQLSAALGASLASIKKIRATVSRAVISDPYVGHGRHAAEFAAGVTKHCVTNSSYFGDDNDDGHNGYASGEKAKERTAGRDAGHVGNGSFPMLSCRPPALMAGAVTALDMCAQALLLKNTCSCNHDNSADGRCHIGSIRTGSSAVDQLLAPGSAYLSFDDGWSMPFPYKIPKCEVSFNNEKDTEFSISRDGKGIPFGMVTEFSGPPSSGKTQLGLSISAHAAFENKIQVHYVSGGNSRKALSRRLFNMCLDLAHGATMPRHGSGSGGGIANQMEEEAKSAALRALDRVTIASASDAFSLLALLARIDREEDYRHGSIHSVKSADNGTLLVVDSVSGCLGHHLSGDRVGPALANQVALMLRQMARLHDGHLGGTSKHVHESSSMIKPRRFAVVVTNGSVVKRHLQNELLGCTRAVIGQPTTIKPAMGRCWHVSDIGIWLEQDRSQSDSRDQPINFYANTPVVGLALADEKVVSAIVQNHYGKSCKSFRGQNTPGMGKLLAKFRIRSGGITDL